MIAAVLKVALGIAIGVPVVVYLLQDRLMFFPQPLSAARRTVIAQQFPAVDEVTLRATDGTRLHAWRVRADAGSPLVLYFGGNAEEVSWMLDVIGDPRAGATPGVSWLLLDYRGYGESEGSATEAGVYRDADAGWDYLTNRPEIDSTRIGVYGRSIGSAVALYLATSRPVRALVLESAFSSGHAMAREHYAFFPQSLVKLDLDNVERATRLTIPLLSVHGSADWIAPIEMGRAVAEAGHAEEFYVIEGSGHNDTYDIGGDAYRQRVHRFLEEHLR